MSEQPRNDDTVYSDNDDSNAVSDAGNNGKEGTSSIVASVLRDDAEEDEGQDCYASEASSVDSADLFQRFKARSKKESTKKKKKQKKDKDKETRQRSKKWTHYECLWLAKAFKESS